jgi:hypothetical protein
MSGLIQEQMCWYLAALFMDHESHLIGKSPYQVVCYEMSRYLCSARLGRAWILHGKIGLTAAELVRLAHTKAV